MALDYDILNKKPIVNRHGVDMYDLAVSTINQDVNVSGSFIVVNKHYVARPDLLSLAVYGDDKYADILCKINGISNPFELNENDIIIIPHVETILDMTTNANEVSVFCDNDKQEIIDNISNTRLQKNVSQERAPNEQLVGDTNYIIDNTHGIVIY